MHCKALHMQP